MSLVASAIRGLAEKGRLTKESTVKDVKFELEILTTEEQLLADGMVDTDALKKKYGAGDVYSTYPDTISKMRTLAILTFAIKKVNGAPVVDEEKTIVEQFKQRLEFKDELAELGTVIVDKLYKDYRSLTDQQRELFADIEENVEKS